MKSGYYQIQIEEGDKYKTTFTYPAGFYQWKVVLFGSKNAPAFFQRRMDFIFGKYDFIITYIDDILIHSPHHSSFKAFRNIRVRSPEPWNSFIKKKNGFISRKH